MYQSKIIEKLFPNGVNESKHFYLTQQFWRTCLTANFRMRGVVNLSLAEELSALTETVTSLGTHCREGSAMLILPVEVRVVQWGWTLSMLNAGFFAAFFCNGKTIWKKKKSERGNHHFLDDSTQKKKKKKKKKSERSNHHFLDDSTQIESNNREILWKTRYEEVSGL